MEWSEVSISKSIKSASIYNGSPNEKPPKGGFDNVVIKRIWDFS